MNLKVLAVVVKLILIYQIGIAQIKDTNALVDFYFKKGKKLFSINYDSSEYYFLKTVQLQKKTKFTEINVEALNYLAALNYYKNEIESFFNYS